MKIKVNNECKIVDDFMTVSTLVGSVAAGVAVAVNGKIVKKADWNLTEIKDGDDIVIIHAAYGG